MDKFCTHFILHAAFCRCAPAFSHLLCGGAKNILPVLRGIVCTAAFCRCTRTFPFDCCVSFCGSNTTFCQCTAAFCRFAHADFCVSFMRGRYNSASAAFPIDCCFSFCGSARTFCHSAASFALQRSASISASTICRRAVLVVAVYLSLW